MPQFNFRSGLQLPIKTSIYQALESKLAFLVDPDPNAPPTDFGPALKLMREVPLPAMAMVKRDPSSGDLQWRKGWAPKTSPSIMAWIGDTEYQPTSNSLSVDASYTVHLYVSTVGNALAGVLTIPDTNTLTTQDPGLHVLEELISDSMHESDLSFGTPNPPATNSLTGRVTVEGTKLLDEIGGAWWSQITLKVDTMYTRCKPSGFQPITNVVINHIVPADAAGPITVQGDNS